MAVGVRCLSRRTSGCNAPTTWGTPFAVSQEGGPCPTGFARTLAAKEKEHGFPHLLLIDEQLGHEAVALPFVLGQFPAADARGA